MFILSFFIIILIKPLTVDGSKPAPPITVTALKPGVLSSVVEVKPGKTVYFSLQPVEKKGLAILALPCTNVESVAYFDYGTTPGPKQGIEYTLGLTNENNITKFTLNGPEGTPCGKEPCETSYFAIHNKEKKNTASYRVIGITPEAGDIEQKIKEIKSHFVSIQKSDSITVDTDNNITFTSVEDTSRYTTKVISIPAAFVDIENVTSVCGINSLMSSGKATTEVLSLLTPNKQVSFSTKNKSILGGRYLVSEACQYITIEVSDKEGKKSDSKYKTICSKTCTHKQCKVLDDNMSEEIPIPVIVVGIATTAFLAVLFLHLIWKFVHFMNSDDDDDDYDTTNRVGDLEKTFGTSTQPPPPLKPEKFVSNDLDRSTSAVAIGQSLQVKL